MLCSSLGVCLRPAAETSAPLCSWPGLCPHISLSFLALALGLEGAFSVGVLGSHPPLCSCQAAGGKKGRSQALGTTVGAQAPF